MNQRAQVSFSRWYLGRTAGPTGGTWVIVNLMSQTFTCGVLPSIASASLAVLIKDLRGLGVLSLSAI